MRRCQTTFACAVGAGIILSIAGSVQAEQPPPLSVRIKQDVIEILWPASSPNWVLEESPRLDAPTAWSVAPPDTYQSNAAFFSLRVASPTASRFYRLRNLTPALSALRAHWALNEGFGPVAEDSAGFLRPLFLSEVDWSEGYAGSLGLRFNGGVGAAASRAWVSNENYQVVPATGRAFTVSFWFNADELSAGWMGLAGTQGAGIGWRLALRTLGPGTNELVFEGIGGGTPLNLAARAMLLPGEWRRLTATYDGSEGTLYLNGALLARGIGSAPTQEGPIYFGGGWDSDPGFKGRLDEIRLFDEALTPGEVAIAGQWHFDDNAGLVAVDSTVFGHHARLTSGIGWTVGKTGAGIGLNGGQVTVPNEDLTVLPATGEPFSLSCWIYPHGLPSGRRDLMRCAAGTTEGWTLALENLESGLVELNWSSTNQGGTLDLRAPARLNVGQWSKLDLTFSGGAATLYLNGARLASGSGAIRSAAAPLVLGGTTFGFDGDLDELTVYNQERADHEIGPVARAMWETVMVNGGTNLVLQGLGPPGRSLTFNFLDLPAPTNGALSRLGGSEVVYQAGARRGPDAFAYTVSDGEFTSAPALVVMSVVQPHWLAAEGGPIEPRDGASPDQAWVAGPAAALDAILKTNQFYDCFFYGPGEFHTSGWKYQARGTANPGCKHIGAGIEATILRLVDTWDATAEGVIFGPLGLQAATDGFEVRHMTLDCNADNNPKYNQGEAASIVIPLESSARVESVTLRWSEDYIPAPGVIPGRGNTSWRIGRPAEYSLCTRSLGPEGYATQCVAVASTGRVDVIPLGISTDQIEIQMLRKPPGYDFYSLEEIEVLGGAVSLPRALTPSDGESQLTSPDGRYSIVWAIDANPGTSWASGLEDEVRLVLPLQSTRLISGLELNWNCQELAGVGRFGPASSFQIRARDPVSQMFYEAPSVLHQRSSTGAQTITFGADGAPEGIMTDQVILVLTQREELVDYYSLREIRLKNGSATVPLKIPAASSTLAWSGVNSTVLALFDKASATRWANRTQGMVGAIEIGGSNIKLTDLWVRGYGAKAGREAFILGVHTPLPWLGSPVHQGNVLVENCVFNSPATNNTDGVSTVSVLGFPPHTLTNAVVRNCAATGGKFKFAYSHGFTCSQVENCLVQDYDHGVYFEPDASWIDVVGPILIRSNLFQNVRRGVYLLMHPGARFDSITAVGNEIVLATSSAGWGFVICDTCDPGRSGTVTNVTLLNNLVRYHDWAARSSSLEGGLFYSDIQHAVFGNNLIALGTREGLRVRHCPSGFFPPEVVTPVCPGESPPITPPPGPAYPPCLDPPPSGYRRAWFNNRDLSNALLPVRFRLEGTDGLATQQQWP